MKRFYLLLFLLLASTATLHASFYARNLSDPNHYSWSYFEMKQLTAEVEAFGLLYQTTITFEIGLTSYEYWDGRVESPQPGTYEITWDFGLFEDAVITDCWIKPAGATEFISAEIIDLTTAEKLYQQYPYSQPRVLLRHRWLRNWNGNIDKRFQMQFSPVTLSKTPVIRIRYLSPSLPYYDTRRIKLPLSEFSVYKQAYPLLKIKDPDNPNHKPGLIYGYAIGAWQKIGDWWQISLDNYGDVLASLATESANRSYLRIYEDQGSQFYQLSVLPPVKEELRHPKNILLAVDLTNRQNNYNSLIQTFKKAVELSIGSKDSVTLIYSAFNPVVVDNAFLVNYQNRLDNLFAKPLGQAAPQLNTLPHLLRQSVDLFNQNDKGGEIWLLSDAYTHSDPLNTAMDIINQTHGKAEKPIAFRIINADGGGWPYRYWINQQYYYGDDYLFENLARISWGSFVKLREHPAHDFLDVMLDCIAPSVNAVEIDPLPASGLSYSRFQLNRGRVNFPITVPYYEIGMFDGSDPFSTRYYGSFEGELFAQDVTIDRQNGDPGWRSTATYWFDRYIQNLLLEPQSFETIEYIESASVDYRLLTPYSGFIIPGPGGVMAFKRLEGDVETAVEAPLEPAAEEKAPQEFKLMAFPNPFNSATTITFNLPEFDDSQPVQIRVINSLGQVIYESTLRAESQSVLRFTWDGNDRNGLPASSGVYLVMVQAGQVSKNVKITLIK